MSGVTPSPTSPAPPRGLAPGGRARGGNGALIAAVLAGVLALGGLALHLWVWPLGWLGSLEAMTVDARFRLRGPRPPATDQVVIVGVDDATRTAYPDLIQTRRGWATLIGALDRYQPKAIVLDLFFSSPEIILPDDLAARVRASAAAMSALAPPPSTPDPAPAVPPPPPNIDQPRPLPPAVAEAASTLRAVAEELRGDEALAAAVAASGRVYLGAFFRTDGRAPTAPPPEPVGLDKGRLGEVVSGGGGRRAPLRARAVNATLPAIAVGARGAGAVNVLVDADGAVRRMPLALALGDQVYGALGLAAALEAQGRAGDSALVVGDATLRAGARALRIGDAAGIPLDFLGPGRLPRVSAGAILDGSAPAEVLAGKLLFVGLTYAAYDKVTTPFSPRTDGIELHATLAENLIGGRLLRPTGPLTALAITAALLLLIALAQLRVIRRRAFVPPLLALGAIAAWVGLAHLAFVSRNLVLPIAAPALLAGAVAATAMVTALAVEGREKAHLRAAFSRYVAPSVVDRILAEPGVARLGGERRDLTVLFSDIRGFSSLSERLPPEELAAFMSEYLTPMTELVLDGAGTLDKYIGDAVMAFWGAPIEQPDHAVRACTAALAMQARLATLSAAWAGRGLPPLAIGVGVNTGPMAVGNMGSRARFDYTVLGDAVNLAARLEGLTKEYAVGILVGEATARAAAGQFVFRQLDQVRVKGRASAAPVFELIGPVGSPAAAGFDGAAWQRGLDAYAARDFLAAATAWDALAARGDGTARVMALRARALWEEPPAPDWDGVYEQRGK
ncbi:MAG: adenylate/guanylate cyclase domain-containing protein [Kofleriaceae bacterium]|nr:adenylate/guanylate cyclase domain-containing protein [Kofleriaceae bacterium]